MGTNTQLTTLPPKLHLVSSVFGLAVCQGTGCWSLSEQKLCIQLLELCLNQWLCLKWLELLKPQASLEGKWQDGRSVNPWLESKYLGPVEADRNEAVTGAENSE